MRPDERDGRSDSTEEVAFTRQIVSMMERGDDGHGDVGRQGLLVRLTIPSTVVFN